MRNPFQAEAMHSATKRGTRTVRALSTYPEVPATWASRALRRQGVKHLVVKAKPAQLVIDLINRALRRPTEAAL
jgi:hypothetical protein